MSGRRITIGELFTEEEIAKAALLAQKHSGTELINKFVEEIVTPALPRINTATQQDNDARYLAYVIEYTLRRGGIIQ